MSFATPRPERSEPPDDALSAPALPQVWNPTNGEIWVLEKEPSGEYEFAGRWRATPYGGAFVDVKFGADKKQPLLDHMKVPLDARAVTPGSPAR